MTINNDWVEGLWKYVEAMDEAIKKENSTWRLGARWASLRGYIDSLEVVIQRDKKQELKQ